VTQIIVAAGGAKAVPNEVVDFAGYYEAAATWWIRQVIIAGVSPIRTSHQQHYSPRGKLSGNQRTELAVLSSYGSPTQP